jgi:hypothetical protein
VKAVIKRCKRDLRVSAISLFEQPSKFEILGGKETGKLIRSDRIVMKISLPHKNKS